MGDKNIREQFTPLDLQVADGLARSCGLTVDEVLISAKLGVSNEQLIQTKKEEQVKWVH